MSSAEEVPVRIRVAEPDDWRKVRDVRLRALADAPEAFESTFELENGFGQAEWEQRTGSATWFLAEAGGQVVGVAVALVQDHYGPTVRHLVSMWVEPGWRGTGTADLLVQALCDRSKGEGARTVTLWVIDDNKAAEKLYERAGFRRSGEAKPLSRDPAREEFRMVRGLD